MVHIQSGLDKDNNHYYCKMFSEKKALINYLKNNHNFFHSTIMLRFGGTKIATEKFYATKKPIKIEMLIL